MPFACPWGAKAHRHGQPRAAKGKLLRQISVKIHVFFICIFRFSGFQVKCEKENMKDEGKRGSSDANGKIVARVRARGRVDERDRG